MLWNQLIHMLLVVLVGDGLGVLVGALRLLELFGRLSIRILILESVSSSLASRFNTGPLPHCITAIPPHAQTFFQEAALHSGSSSIMYLMSIHRAPKRRNLEKPSTHESLIVCPCAFPSNAISYHPQVYSAYLKNVLEIHKNVSFATVRDYKDIEATIRRLGSEVVVFNYDFMNPNLSDFQLSSIHWEGIPDWKMPDIVHWIKKRKGIPKLLRKNSSEFDIVSNAPFYDLSGALNSSDIMIEHFNSLLANAKLRWSRL